MSKSLFVLFVFCALEFLAMVHAVPTASLLFPRNDDIITQEITIVAVLVSDFRMPEQGSLMVELNGHDVGRQTPPADEEGNANINIAVPSLPPGLHTVKVTLLDLNDDPIGVGDEVEFIVDYVTGDSSDEDAHSSNVQQPDFNPLDICPTPARKFCKGNNQGCSNHGKCHRGICICDPNWIGDYCDVEIFEDSVYFPEIDPHLSPSRCMQSTQFSQGQQELLQELQNLHSKENCNEENTLIYGTRFHGFGAQMHFLSVALNDAYRNNKAMILSGNWTYSNHDECNPKGHLCHFESHFTYCNTEALVNNRNVIHHPPADSHYVPEKYQHQGVLWYRAQLLHFLLRPNAGLEATLRKVKGALNWPPTPVIGVHVRRGDSCNHAEISDFKPKCHDFEEHSHHIARMSERYNIRHFFVASDNQQTIDQAIEFAKQKDLKVLYINFDRSIFDARWFLEFRMHYGIVDKKTVSESAIIDLFLLSDCDYFVGAFSGQMTRLAFELMVLRKGFYPPYASVDYPWCFHFMEKKRVGNFGEKNC